MKKPLQFQPVGKSLSFIVVIFVCIVASLLLLNNVRSQILSGVRAYVSGEGLYSKAQKDAVYHLVRYAQSRAERDYERFRNALAVPLGDREARLELERPHPDLVQVQQGLIAGRNHPDDVDSIVKLFRRFRHVRYMSKAVDIWAQADGLIVELGVLGDRLHALVTSRLTDPDKTARLLQELNTLNEQLTGLEDEFSRTLGEGNRWLERRLWQLTYAAATLLVIGGVVLSAMILRQVHAADHALRAQAERWRVTLTSIGDGVLVTDARARIVSLNPAAESLTGWKEADAVGKPVQEVFHLRAERDLGERLTGSVLGEGMIVGLDNAKGVLLAKDETERSVDSSAAPIRDRDGNIVGMVLVFRDVSARRRAEEALRWSEERYRSLVAATASVVWTTEADGSFVSPQPAWEAYTGRRWEEDAAAGWLSALHPDDRERVRGSWARSLAERTIFQAEARVLNAASGRYRHVVVQAVPLLNAERSVREWIGTLTDIDDRTRAEEALQEASRQKDKFLAILAHEVRNPLTSIRSAAHILQRVGSREPHVAHAREMIDRQVARMSRLLDDLLDVSRVARGKMSLHQEVVDLAQLMRVAAEDYRTTLEASGVTLTSVVPDEPVWVRGDSTRLSQVISNLLHNASKFTNPGGQVTMKLTDEPAGNAVLSVQDNGIGMEAAVLERVFDASAQAEQSLESGRGGLGLGLALVKGLVQLHRGTVHAFSMGPGKGSEFIIRLPLAPQPRARGATTMSRPGAQRPCRVLVIEDNLDVAESMKYLLETDGHEVAVAHNGPAGIEAARQFRPQLVLCDINLPGGLDGFGVAQMIRADATLNSAYLVALTGYGREQDQRRAREAGFDMHLIKPVDPAVLDRVLAELSDRAELQPASV